MASRFEFELENGSKFYIRRYDVFLAMKVLGEVQKKFLTSFALLMDANDKTLPQELRDRHVQDAIEKISTNLDGDILVDLVKRVLNPEYVSVSIGGGPPDKLDEGMLNRATDSLYDVIALVFQVLRFNYEDLFTRGRNLIGQAQAPEPMIH